MGFLLSGLSYVSYVLFSVLAVLSLASGLYYLAEFVEEYIVLTKRVLTRALQAVIFLHLLLLVVDDLPLWCVLFGLATHILYYQLLSNFPFLEFTDLTFIGSCGNYHPFGEILAFFTICVWLIPFGFFISLSANEHALPGALGASIDESSGKHKKSRNVLVSMFDFLKTKRNDVLPSESFGPSSFEKLN